MPVESPLVRFPAARGRIAIPRGGGHAVQESPAVLLPPPEDLENRL